MTIKLDTTAARVIQSEGCIEASSHCAEHDVLLLSGLPLYSERGRGGGWALLDGPAINLSALTTEEAQPLFLVTGPALLAGLGLEQRVTSAVRKLLAALPANTREQADRTRQAIHIDPTRWGRAAQPAPAALAPLRAAVIAGVHVDLTYAPPASAATVHHVHPYGLVSKGGSWYLVAGADAGLRTFRVSRVINTDATTEPVERPDGFDLRPGVGGRQSPPGAVLAQSGQGGISGFAQRISAVSPRRSQRTPSFGRSTARPEPHAGSLPPVPRPMRRPVS